MNMNLNNFVSTSHALQDAFALEICGESGVWLEIGASYPEKKGNNTALLELKGWTGVSLEQDSLYLNLWEQSWRNEGALLITDATTFDYSTLQTTHFDYVQIDIDPTFASYVCLEKILNLRLVNNV